MILPFSIIVKSPCFLAFFATRFINIECLAMNLIPFTIIISCMDPLVSIRLLWFSIHNYKISIVFLLLNILPFFFHEIFTLNTIKVFRFLFHFNCNCDNYGSIYNNFFDNNIWIIKLQYQRNMLRFNLINELLFECYCYSKSKISSNQFIHYT